MKRIGGVENFEQMRKRKLARARQIDRGVQIEPEARIMFERTEDLLACLTPSRVRIIAAARKKEQSVSELAVNLDRNRTAVQRDVKVLKEHGLLKMTKRTNPGHGVVQMVKAVANQFT